MGRQRNTMPDERQHGLPTEDELVAALSRQSSLPHGNCPTKERLKDFVLGKYKAEDAALEAMLEHLADCPNCGQQLAEIRIEMEASKRWQSTTGARQWMYSWRVAVALLAVVAFIGLWWWTNHQRASEVAVVDLRLVTRGGEPPSSAASIVLHSTSDQILILLPNAMPLSGRYELGIFQTSDLNTPILSGSVSAAVTKDGKTLKWSVGMNKLHPGSYLLGLRQAGGNWSYYPTTVD